VVAGAPFVRLALFFALGAPGCTFTVGRVAVLSTRTVALPLEAADAPAMRRGRGRRCVPIVGAVPVGRLPRVGDAVDDAIGPDGHLLRDAVIRFRLVYVPFVAGAACYEAEGDVQ